MLVLNSYAPTNLISVACQSEFALLILGTARITKSSRKPAHKLSFGSNDLFL